MKNKEIKGAEEFIPWVKDFCTEVKKVSAQKFACEALTIGTIYGYVVRDGSAKKIMDKAEHILKRNGIAPFQMWGLKLSQNPSKPLPTRPERGYTGPGAT
jgi:hypothetical protein